MTAKKIQEIPGMDLIAFRGFHSHIQGSILMAPRRNLAATSSVNAIFSKKADRDWACGYQGILLCNNLLGHHTSNRKIEGILWSLMNI